MVCGQGPGAGEVQLLAGGMSRVRKDLGCLVTGCRVLVMASSDPFYGEEGGREGSEDKIKRPS